MTVSDDYELVLQAQKGDMAAFEQLVYRYDKQVLSIALSQVGNSEDARDVYQEVFMRVYRALPSFRHESKFSTWLHRIATNVCLTHRYRRKRHEHASLDQHLNPDDEGSGFTLADTIAADARSDQATMNAEISERVQEAMESLSPQQRLVFTLRHFQGHKLKDIAEMMNCAEGTVKKYLFTATERLRAQLREVF